MVHLISSGLAFVSDILFTVPCYPLLGAVLFAPLLIACVRLLSWT